MKSTRLIAVLVGMAAIAMVAADAHAIYHPGMGRFLQRDPGAGAGSPARIGSVGPAVGGGFAQRDPMPAGPSRIGATGPAIGGRFAQRDPITRPKNRTAQAGPSSQYNDGMNLYQYARSNPNIYVDPSGLCTEVLKFKGHGMSTQCDMGKKSVAKKECIPEFMTNGIPDGSPILDVGDVKAACNALCCDAELRLYSCGIGNNEAYMKKLASGCSKIKKVCGYTRLLRYIPWTNIILPNPFAWNCIDVN